MDSAAQDGALMGMEEVFGSHGILAKGMDGYEFRPGQLAMAEAVAGILQAGVAADWNRTTGGEASMLAVEAGTGIGKTLGYLVPAVQSGQKIVVSTGTLNLQEQILTKEIPFLREHVDPFLSALCVKGRQNYLCLYRYRQFDADPQMALFHEDGRRSMLKDWVEETEFADRAELSWLTDDSPLWQHLSCATNQCLGVHCPEAQACFINRLRRRAAKARLLIVNHHLFFSDLALRRFGFAEVLPRYESVIFDEAHRLEEVATRYFGISFSHYQLLDLVQDVEKIVRQQLAGKAAKKTTQLVGTLVAGADRFAALFPRKNGRFPLLDCLEGIIGWENELHQFLDLFGSVANHLENLTPVSEAWEGLLNRCEGLAANLRKITLDQDSSHVYWGERREKTVLLAASPIDVAQELRQSLYSEVRSIVFTSATLTAGGNFSYFSERLGLPSEADTLALATPFNYADRTLLYIPENAFPAPIAADFSRAAGQRILDLLLLARGRALVLFTSLSAMRVTRDFLDNRLPYPLLVQGEAPKQVLLDSFRSDTHSVLLAVASFWEGVDVPGEALSCVIIDKLPFEVPSDPVMMARMEAVREQGGNPFFDFQVPRAILTLRQGVGRLMRKASDRGVMAILDIRLFSKSYGRIFLRSLPPSPIARKMEGVADFFGAEDKIG